MKIPHVRGETMMVCSSGTRKFYLVFESATMRFYGLSIEIDEKDNKVLRDYLDQIMKNAEWTRQMK